MYEGGCEILSTPRFRQRITAVALAFMGPTSVAAASTDRAGAPCFPCTGESRALKTGFALPRHCSIRQPDHSRRLKIFQDDIEIRSRTISPDHSAGLIVP